jgi:hypothetical protein
LKAPSTNYILLLLEIQITCILFYLDYLVLEQVCVASLDCNRLDVANDCLKALSSQFQGSNRILLLKAQHLEARERYKLIKNYNYLIFVYKCYCW